MLDVKRPEVFEEIFHEYYASLCYFANKFVQDEDAAKDIVQEVFVHFWESKGRFENRVALKSFLYSCVQNGALNYLNKLRSNWNCPLRIRMIYFVLKWKRMFSRRFLLP